MIFGKLGNIFTKNKDIKNIVGLSKMASPER